MSYYILSAGTRACASSFARTGAVKYYGKDGPKDRETRGDDADVELDTVPDPEGVVEGEVVDVGVADLKDEFYN
jgi:hypothetical protein